MTVKGSRARSARERMSPGFDTGRAQPLAVERHALRQAGDEVLEAMELQALTLGARNALDQSQILHRGISSSTSSSP